MFYKISAGCEPSTKVRLYETEYSRTTIMPSASAPNEPDRAPQSYNNLFSQPQNECTTKNPLLQGNPSQSLLSITQQSSIANGFHTNPVQVYGQVIPGHTMAQQATSSLSGSLLAQTVDIVKLARRQRNIAAEVQVAVEKNPGYTLRDILDDGILLRRIVSKPDEIPVMLFVPTP